jgi:hypothetical protein
MENIQKDEAMPQVRKEEEIRADIITEFGFDEEADVERIDKLVAKQMESDKKLSDAIGQKIKYRTEKEELLKNPPKVEPPKEENKFSPKDYLALSQAKVPAEKFDEIQEYANFKKISLAEALNTDYVKDTLKRHEEEKKSAEATNTDGGRRTSSKDTGESLLDKAEQGQSVDEDDISKLTEARFERKLKK